MAEYIECRNCDSPNCEGCNILTLAKMLHDGKFDCLMDANHSVDRFADVEPVRHGRWEHLDDDWFDLWKCTACGEEWTFSYDPTNKDTVVNYCPDCGATMDLEVSE